MALLMPTALGWAATLRTREELLHLDWSSVVRQTQTNTCGPAVIATLLATRGVFVTDLDIASRSVLTPLGMSLQEFGRLAALMGFDGAWMRATTKELESIPLPGVVHLKLNDGHFAILVAMGPEQVQLLDPARGNIVVSRSVFSRWWSGRVFVIRA